MYTTMYFMSLASSTTLWCHYCHPQLTEVTAGFTRSVTCLRRWLEGLWET